MSAERETIYSGLSHAAWGYFFLHIHLKLNGINILPSFVGFLLLLSACGKLSSERRDLALLRPLAMLLAAWRALDWLASWIGQGVDGHILFLDLLIAAVALYFHFQFLTDMAVLAEQYQPQGDGLAQCLRRRRTVYIVMLAAFDLFQNLPVQWNAEWQVWAMTGGLIVALIVALLIMAGLFRLRRCFQETEATDE